MFQAKKIFMHVQEFSKTVRYLYSDNLTDKSTLKFLMCTDEITMPPHPWLPSTCLLKFCVFFVLPCSIWNLGFTFVFSAFSSISVIISTELNNFQLGFIQLKIKKKKKEKKKKKIR